MEQKRQKRLPPWFKIRLATGDKQRSVRSILRQQNLHTVCEGAACPNRTECWNSGTATFLILGDVCTRNCRFCNIPPGRPVPVMPDEPDRVARSVKALNLNYAVVTSVTRDDLSDGGASLFAETIKAVRRESPCCKVEVLIPDLRGSEQALGTILDAAPDVLAHNVETVPRLYPVVRPQAVYARSLEVLRRAHEAGAAVKSGFMVGLGEGIDEVHQVMYDLLSSGCSLLTVGQYLQPTREHLQVERFYDPDEFRAVRQRALDLGFETVAAGPLVRSSYRAAEMEACATGRPPVGAVLPR